MTYKYNAQGTITEPAKNRTIPINSWIYRDEVQPWLDAGNTIEPFRTAAEQAEAELTEAKAAINADTAAKMASFEVEALGKTFDFTEQSKNNFDALLGRLEAGKIPALPWRYKGTRDNTDYTIDEANEIALAVIVKVSQIDTMAQDKKKELEN